eukprot:5831220-Pyramimonas_sp.AAC.1
MPEQPGGHHHTQGSGSGQQQSYVGTVYTPQSGLLAGEQLPAAKTASPAGMFMTTERANDSEKTDSQHWSAVSVH